MEISTEIVPLLARIGYGFIMYLPHIVLAQHGHVFHGRLGLRATKPPTHTLEYSNSHPASAHGKQASSASFLAHGVLLRHASICPARLLMHVVMKFHRDPDAVGGAGGWGLESGATHFRPLERSVYGQSALRIKSFCWYLSLSGRT